MSLKLERKFYLRPAVEVAKDLLGKYLVVSSPQNRLSGKIIEVEAYPAFVDKVSHGNKRTKRTEIMYGPGGYAYVYLIYGLHHQFAVVVNQREVPEVVFIRAVIPKEGIEIMRQTFGKTVKRDADMTKTPGNLCRTFGIDLQYCGADLTGGVIYIEDREERVVSDDVRASRRVGIDPKLTGASRHLRFYLVNNS